MLLILHGLMEVFRVEGLDTLFLAGKTGKLFSGSAIARRGKTELAYRETRFVTGSWD
jgi:hypothetical protein